ncbi:rhomboid family intramembrane serine protease [Flavobacterium sp.]
MNEQNHFKFTPSVWIIPTLLLMVVWGVFLFEDKYNLKLTQLGIYPRTLSGLKGIVFSPFLHGDINHIASNSVPLFVLTLALIYFYRDLSLKVLVYGILVSGIITWIIGRSSYHIGASSLIYVLVSFIFLKGLMTKYYRLMALSLTVVMIYGGMVWYVFPEVDNKISWEGHLSGLLTGFVFAVYYKTPDYVKSIQYNWEKPDFSPQEDAFMKRFDENGNFVNLPKEEELEVPEQLSSQINYVYEYKEAPKENGA